MQHAVDDLKKQGLPPWALPSPALHRRPLLRRRTRLPQRPTAPASTNARARQTGGPGETRSQSQSCTEKHGAQRSR